MAGTAVVSAGLGIFKAVKGSQERKKAEAERKKHEAEMARLKDEYMDLDISNPYLNMQNVYDDMANVYEDMVVNQQEAQFVQQQQQQSQANVLDKMRSAAGGSGIAALAQTMAQQGALDAQQAAVSIGKQEQDIQAKQLGEAARMQDLVLGEDQRIQDLHIEGELDRRAAEAARLQTMFDFTATDIEAAAARESAAQQQMWGGITDATGAIAGGVSTHLGMMQEGVPMGKSAYDPEAWDEYYKQKALLAKQD